MLQSVANRIIEFRPDGTICDRLGTYDEYLEYQAALNQAMNQRSGVYGGYNPNMNMNNAGGCNASDICNGLICADCCCECMGGDLIPCC